MTKHTASLDFFVSTTSSVSITTRGYTNNRAQNCNGTAFAGIHGNE